MQNLTQINIHFPQEKFKKVLDFFNRISCSNKSQVIYSKLFIKNLLRICTTKIDKVSAIVYTINMNTRIVKIAQLADDKAPFIEWMDSLDKNTKIRIQSRLTRLLENNFGDHKKIDNEISELRFKFGAGYRIYFTEIDNIIVLLINGGDKSTQSKDILKAKSILQEWRNLQ